MLTLSAAIALARREIARLEMALDERRLSGGPWPVLACEARTADGRRVVAYGKGPGAQAEASALFETLERAIMTAQDNGRSGAARRMMSSKQLAAQPEVRPDEAVQRWAVDHPDAVTAATAYHSRDGRELWYPVFLVDPRYHLAPEPGDTVTDFRDYLRYTSSLGTASGSTWEEAALHGLCELIEHDALSLALISWFRRGEDVATVVDPDLLPGSLQPLWAEVCDRLRVSPILADLTTDLAVPVYVAVLPEHDFEGGLFGAGASLDAEHAAARALSELLQSHALAEPGADRVPAALDSFAVLRHAFRFRLGDRLGGTVKAALKPPVDATNDVETELAALVALLDGVSLTPYFGTVSTDESLVSVVTAVAPGLERFSLVHMGIPVVPTGRGLRAWREAGSLS
jgi:ribosomal protein S12 methylthiotransferase accessory factor